MTSPNIVTRLNTLSDALQEARWEALAETVSEAATEIERLRNDLKECENLLDLYERAEADRTRFL